MALLETNQNQRGIENLKNMGAQAGGLKSFGIGLTQQRKLARQIGRDHNLARQLWNTRVYDAKVISLLVDESTRGWFVCVLGQNVAKVLGNAARSSLLAERREPVDLRRVCDFGDWFHATWRDADQDQLLADPQQLSLLSPVQRRAAQKLDHLARQRCHTTGSGLA